MALEIQYPGGQREWYIGQSINLSPYSQVIGVYADGHELAAILDKFTNLPMLKQDAGGTLEGPRGYSMRWFGPDAQFIVGNLYLL